MTQKHKISSIPENGSKGLSIKHGEHELKVIVVRQGTDIYCYHNSCPHTGVSLDWTPNQFLDTSGELIQCSTHGALFRITDGYCVAGPCAGQNLRPLKLKVKNEIFEIDFS